jgi:hypothetical protein
MPTNSPINAAASTASTAAVQKPNPALVVRMATA